MEIQDALLIVDRYIASPGLRMHSLGVSRVAKVIAEALGGSRQQVDVERTVCMGLIHDLGREQFNTDRHGIEGYKLARQVGVPLRVSVSPT